jgi:hypothetical protein
MTLANGLTTTDGAEFQADASWIGGTFTGPSIGISASATIVINGQVTLAGSIAITNAGTVRIEGGGSPLGVTSPCGAGNAASWSNAGALAFSDSIGGSVSLCSGSFTNTGTVTHPGTAQDVLFANQLTNSGTITAEAGSLLVYSVSLTDGSIGGGAGRVILDGAATTMSSVVIADNVWVIGTLSGTMVVSEGSTLHVGYDANHPGQAMAASTVAGTITGSGTLSVIGHEFNNWPNGSYVRTATVAADLDMTTAFLGDHSALVAKPNGTPTVISVHATVQVAGYVTLSGSMAIINNGTIDLTLPAPSAPWPGLVSPCVAGNAVSWLNAGSLIFSDSTGGSVSLCYGSFTNTGSVSHPGTAQDVLLAGQLTSTGTITAQAGLLLVYSVALAGGSIGGGEGHVMLDGSSTTTSSAIIADNVWVIGSLSGTAVVSQGATLHISYDPSYPTQSLRTGTVAGTVTGAGTLSAIGHEYNNWPNGSHVYNAVVAADLDIATVVLGYYAVLSRKPDTTSTVISAHTAVRIAGNVTLSGSVAVINNGIAEINVTPYLYAPTGGISSPCGTGNAVSWQNLGSLAFGGSIATSVYLCSGSFTNPGSVRHTSTAQDQLFAAQLASTGTISAQAGMLTTYSLTSTSGSIGGGAGQVVLDGAATTTPSVIIADNVWVVGVLSGTAVVSGGATLHIGYDPVYPAQSLNIAKVSGTVTGPGALHVVGHEFNNWPNGSYQSVAIIEADLDVGSAVLGEFTTLAAKPDNTATVISSHSIVTMVRTPTLSPGVIIRNHGLMDFGANGYFACGDCTFVNENNGAMRLYNPDGDFTHGFAINNGTFENKGLVKLTGYLPGTWIWFGPNVVLTGAGKGRAEYDGLLQPGWVQNLQTSVGVAPFATAIALFGLSNLVSNMWAAAQAHVSGLGLGRCIDVTAGISIAGASAGLCVVIDPSGAEAVVLSVSGGIEVDIDRNNPVDASQMFTTEPSASIDTGGQVFWVMGPGGREFSVHDDLEGLSWCQSGTAAVPVEGVGLGATGQHCWGPQTYVPFNLDLSTIPLAEPGVHSAYLGAVVGTPGYSVGASVSYSVTLGCGHWYSLTLQACGPINTIPPSVSGTSTVGQTLTADHGTWAAGDTNPTFNLTYHYQWQRCSTSSRSSCTPISQATNATYALSEADRNKWIVVQVTASNTGTSSPPILSELTGPTT